VVFSNYPIGEVFSTRREFITNRIAETLRASLGQNDIVLDEVLLRDLRFSPAYAAAVQSKQIAQQNAQRMQYVLQKAQIQKQIQILAAQGEARSIQLRGRAIAQNSRVVQYEYARKIAPNVGAIITDGRVALPFPAGANGANGR
jgi:prohibitin 2